MIFDYDRNSPILVFRTRCESLADRLASIVEAGPIIISNGIFNVPVPKSFSTEITLLDLSAGDLC